FGSGTSGHRPGLGGARRREEGSGPCSQATPRRGWSQVGFNHPQGQEKGGGTGCPRGRASIPCGGRQGGGTQGQDGEDEGRQTGQGQGQRKGQGRTQGQARAESRGCGAAGGGAACAPRRPLLGRAPS